MSLRSRAERRGRRFERWRRPTIRLRLTIWYATMFLIGGAVLLATSYVIVSRDTGSFQQRVEQQMAARGYPSQGIAAVTRGGHGETNGAVPEGRGQSGAGQGTTQNGSQAPIASGTQSLRRFQQVQAIVQQSVRADIRRQTLRDFLIALLGMTLLSVLSGWLVAGRALRPMSQITATAQRVAGETDLSQRIGLKGPADELRELADTFDTMLGRLDRAFSSQRSFVANASHELRTPLAIMRAEIDDRLDDSSVGEAELREMAQVIRDAVIRSEAVVSGLLLLARSEHPHRSDPVDLAELVSEAAASPTTTREAQLHRITLSLPADRVPYRGDRSLLATLIGNLIENAARYNVDGGAVAASAWRDAKQAVIIVSNSGPLIEQEDVRRLFEPFFRAGRSRSRGSGGAGLGLSIVAAVAAAHGGSAEAETRDGGGLKVTVVLPDPPVEAPGEEPGRSRARLSFSRRAS